MRAHLKLTTDEVVARLQRTGPTTSGPTTRSTRQTLNMADMLSDGLVAQFPGRFR